MGEAAGSGKTYLSADELLRDSWRLAALVRESGWRPDCVVALWRGGSAPGVAVHEFLKATGWNVRHMPLKCGSYVAIGESSGVVGFSLLDETLATFRPGERALVVDDVFDSGRTIEAVAARMAAAGVEMRSACVYWKPSRNVTRMRPDYWAKELGDGWIVFPHEMEGLAPDELREKDPLLAELAARAVRG